MERCKHCHRWIYQDSGEQYPWNVRDDEVDANGTLLRRLYSRTCAPSLTGQHEPGEREAEPYSLEPKFNGNGDGEPISAKNVRSGYANLMDSINRVNQMLDPGERFMVPFGVQEALVRYIEEREAIESLTRT